MNITDISGIGDATAQRLKAHGIDSVEAVAQASIEQLAAVPGIGASRAAALGESARGLLPDASADAESAEAVPAPAGDAEEGSETAAAPAGDGSEAKRKKDGKKEKGKKDKKKKGKAEKKKEKKRKEGRRRAREARRRKTNENRRSERRCVRRGRSVARCTGIRHSGLDPFSGTPLGREPRVHAD